jgi:putative MATE family efflux protein
MPAAASSATDVRPAAPVGDVRRVFDLAWPVALSQSTVTLLLTANLYWIGHLGTVAVAAVALCSHILFLGFCLTQIVFAGALAIISRRIGEGRPDEAWGASFHAAVLGVLLGVGIGVNAWWLAPSLLQFFEAGREIEDQAIPFLRIALAGQAFFFVPMALAATYQGNGDTRTPMRINIAVVLLNAVIDPFFIFAPGEITIAGFSLGWLGAGVRGAAIADVLASGCGTAIFIGMACLRGPLPRPRGRSLAVSPAELWRIARIGVPACISMLARPLSTFFLLKVVATFGAPAVAAFGITLRAYNLNWIPLGGIGAAVSTLVGQRLGARQTEAAERLVHRAAWAAAALGVAFWIGYGTYAREFIAFFDANGEVVAIGGKFLAILAASMAFSAVTVPLVAAMNGAGDTRVPMFAAFLANWPVKLPLAWALAVPFGWGLDGVWWGLFLSVLLEAALVALWFRRGAWKTRSV